MTPRRATVGDPIRRCGTGAGDSAGRIDQNGSRLRVWEPEAGRLDADALATSVEATALLDEPSHGLVALSDADVFMALIQCWQHGSCSDVVTGEPTGPPATAGIPVFQVRSAASMIAAAVPSGSSELSGS